MAEDEGTLAARYGAEPLDVLVAAVAAVVHRHTAVEAVIVAIDGQRDERMFTFAGDPTMHAVIGRASGVRDAERARLQVLSADPARAVILDVAIDRRAQAWDISVGHVGALFGPVTGEMIAARLHTFVRAWAAATGELAVSRVSMLTAEELDQVVYAWNATDADVPAMTVVELFELQAARTPDRIAIVCDDTSLTFAELDRRSTRMAGALRRAGVQRDVCVGVYLARSLDLVVALLGIMKSGGTYVPLDVAQPTRRIAQILAEARTRVIVADRGREGGLPVHDGTVVFGDADAELSPDVARPALDAVAYVMFTSGSTGTPKGVEISHRALTNFLWSMRERPGFTADDVLVAVTTISFDISGLELYLPLVTGGRLVLSTGRTSADGVRLARLLDDSGATVLQATPATWRMLFASGWRGSPRLKALCGGEALPPDLARALGSATGSLWNMYGPTETTIWSTVDEVARDASPISIGRPIANTRCYVLDAHGEPVPIGIPGELFIGGHGVARGYLHRAELTDERFVRDPFRPGERMYRTGDLARWLPDGRLEHLGRLDHQVKIRGFRIELGEIEAVLARHEGVREAIVMAHEVEPGDLRLVAYVTLTAPSAAGLLARHLRDQLPSYMVPSAFVVVQQFALTPSGKIDRKQLVPTGIAPTPVDITPPASPLEAEIAQIWCDVLKIAPFDRESEFSALGGHSLLATQVISRIHAATGLQLPIDVMFDEPTVPALARAIEQMRSAPASVAPDLAIVALGRSEGPAVQTQRYFFRLGELDPAISFGKEYVTWRITGPLDAGALTRAMHVVIGRHEILRTNFARDGLLVRQIVRPAEPPYLPDLELDDVSARPSDEPDALAIERSARPFIDKTFDVERGEVLRAKLIRLGTDDHVLITSMHHLVFDYASWFMYADELGTAYRMFTSGAAPADVSRALGDLPFQFLDVATRLDAHTDSAAGRAILDAWRRKMDGAEPVRLPADHPRDEVDAARALAQQRGPSRTHVDQYDATFPAGVVTVSTDAAFADAATKFIERERTTPLAFLLTGLATLMHGETGQTDLAFNTNVGARPFLAADRLIGPFQIPTFVRVDLSGRPTYRELLARVRKEVVDMLRYANVPVLERVPHHVGRMGFGFFGMNISEPVLDLGSTRTALLPSWPSRMDTHFDFWPMLDLRRRGLTAHFIHNKRLFERPTVERLSASYLTLLRAIMADPSARIG